MTRMGSTPQVFVGGVQLAGLAGWGELVVTHRWPLGCWELAWQMPLKAYTRYSSLRAGQLVEARMGSTPIWAGALAEPNWDDGTFTAIGACREGEEAICLTAGGVPTSTPDTAVDQAIARGMVSWSRPVSLQSTPFGAADETDKVNYVGAMLDAWSVEVNKAWYVNARREVRADAYPTSPTWMIRPGAGVLGVGDGNQVGTIYGRYVNTSGQKATTSVGSGSPDVAVNLIARGAMTVGRANAILTGIATKAGATTGWLNGVTLSERELSTLSGERGSFSLCKAGDMTRFAGLRDERGSTLANTDFVIGESIWDVSAATLQLNPVNLERRDLSALVSDVGGELL